MRKKKSVTPKIDFEKIRNRTKYFDETFSDGLDKVMRDAYHMIQRRKEKLDSLEQTYDITSIRLKRTKKETVTLQIVIAEEKYKIKNQREHFIFYQS